MSACLEWKWEFITGRYYVTSEFVLERDATWRCLTRRPSLVILGRNWIYPEYCRRRKRTKQIAVSFYRLILRHRNPESHFWRWKISNWQMLFRLVSLWCPGRAGSARRSNCEDSECFLIAGYFGGWANGPRTLAFPS